VRAKISRGFDLLDSDGDGALTQADHVSMGHRAADELGYSADSPERSRIIEAYVGIWRLVHAPRANEVDGRLTKEAFVASTLALSEDPEAAAASVGALAREFFAIADVDRDGLVSAREFEVFQRSHFPGIGRDELAVAFAHLDRDGDGALSAAEFESAIVEYWTSADPQAAGNWWMGRPDFLPGLDV
jgi:Ca2+-binding EF-hand superfamily protein